MAHWLVLLFWNLYGEIWMLWLDNWSKSCQLKFPNKNRCGDCLLLICCFSAVSLSTLPSSLSQGYRYIQVSKYFTEWLSVTVPGGYGLQHCQVYFLPRARALPGSTNLVVTSAQAHLLICDKFKSRINCFNYTLVNNTVTCTSPVDLTEISLPCFSSNIKFYHWKFYFVSPAVGLCES